ncbi:MAG: autoinducer binding domain-containing protein [Pseudomonadota bacterium]
MSTRSDIENQLKLLARMCPSGYFVGLHIRFAAPMLHFQTYSPAWTDHYTEQAYALRDPMIAWGFGTEGRARWSDIKIPDPFDILGQAANYGMVYGIIFSCGPVKSRTIASASRDDREFTNDEIEQFSGIVHHLHEITDPPDSLTQAQADALRCIAEGDRHARAAAKLRISESALKARLNSARQRLMARTTAEAIQRAKDYRLI